MDFLTRMFTHPPDQESADVAKQRLRLVLAQDRTHISPETLNVLKDEMIAVISKHVEIDRANVQVSITHTSQGGQLIANIPVVGTREPARPAMERARHSAPRAPLRSARARAEARVEMGHACVVASRVKPLGSPKTINSVGYGSYRSSTFLAF